MHKNSYTISHAIVISYKYLLLPRSIHLQISLQCKRIWSSYNSPSDYAPETASSSPSRLRSAASAPRCRAISRSASCETRFVCPGLRRNRQFQRSSFPTTSPPAEPFVSKFASGVCSISSVLAASILLSIFCSSFAFPSLTPAWPICASRLVTEMS